MPKPETIAVAMSGGVDSSTVAAMLAKAAKTGRVEFRHGDTATRNTVHIDRIMLSSYAMYQGGWTV